jgi:hypothetical protein
MIVPALKVNDHVATVRGSGHTTALALQILAAAIANPGEYVEIRDHHGSLQADRALYTTVYTYARLLELHLDFSLTAHKVKAWPRGVKGEAPYVTR